MYISFPLPHQELLLIALGRVSAIMDCLRCLVSENAAYFVSTEFKEFINKNGIRHVTSSPFHASSNGLAERAVQTFKTMMKKAGEGSVASKVARVLFSYRITPQSPTGISLQNAVGTKTAFHA